MTFLYMTFYELKNRRPITASAIVTILLALMAVAALNPVAELVKDETLKAARLSVAFVDEEKSMYTEVFAEQILASPSIKNNIEIIRTDRSDALQKLRNDEIAGIIVIPAIFTAGMQNGDFQPLEVYLNRTQPLGSQLLLEGMESGAYLMSAVQNALYTVYSFLERIPLEQQELDRLFNKEMFTLIGEAMKRSEIYSRETKTPWQDLNLVSFYSYSVLLVFMFILSTSGITAYYEAEKSRINSRLTLTKARAGYPAIVGALVSGGILFLYGVIIYSGIALTAGLRIAPHLLLLIALNMSALSMVVGVLAKNPGRAVGVVTGLNIFWALASGVLIPFYYLPEYIPEGIKYFTPHYWWWQLLSPVGQGGTLTTAAVTAVFTAVLFIALALMPSLEVLGE